MNVNLSGIIALLSHRNLHKLSGFALGLVGVANGIATPAGWKEVTIGGAYAAIMHLVGGIKKLPD